jgi:hypothetical protein
VRWRSNHSQAHSTRGSGRTQERADCTASLLIRDSISRTDEPFTGLEIEDGGQLVLLVERELSEGPVIPQHRDGINEMDPPLCGSISLMPFTYPCAAQGAQLKRCSSLSHRSRGLTASLPQRGHLMPLGQRTCRKESAAFWSSCRYGIRCFIGLLQRDVSNHMRPILPEAVITLCYR